MLQRSDEVLYSDNFFFTDRDLWIVPVPVRCRLRLLGQWKRRALRLGHGCVPVGAVLLKRLQPGSPASGSDSNSRPARLDGPARGLFIVRRRAGL